MTQDALISNVSLDDEIRRQLDRVLPRRPVGSVPSEMGIGTDDVEPGRRYLATTVGGGWAVPSWPRRYGGRDAGPDEAAAIARVLPEYDVPDLYIYVIGLNMVGPALLEFGTTTQQERWLRPITEGVDIWCQLFSEPEAGSDLANVGLRAERDGAQWRMRGQKTWVSRARWSRWGLLLARTDPHVPKHAGLTMFAIDMRASGIDIRPLAQMNGDRHFSEVFFDGVCVPDGHRIGPVGEGWRVAMRVLSHERAWTGDGPHPPGAELPPWLVDLARRDLLDEPRWRDRAMRVFINGEVLRLAAAMAAGRSGPWGSAAKLRKVAQFKAEASLRKDAQGAHGMLAGHDGHLEFLTAPSMSIRGGTDEIQRNIVAERILGLPPEPREDRSAPWRTSAGRAPGGTDRAG